MAGKVKLNRFAEGINVGSPTANDIKASGLEVYATDAAYVTAHGTAAAGDAYINSTDLSIHYYDGTNWKVESTQIPSYSSAANFVTQNGTASNGDVYYDSTLNKLQAYQNGSWGDLGGGGSTVGLAEDFWDGGGDATDGDAIGDWATGQNATFDGGGSLGGTWAKSQTAADLINGADVWKLTGHATAGNNTNDYVASQPIAIPQGLRGRILRFAGRYKWTGTTGNIAIRVKDTTNGDILTLDSDTLDKWDDSTNNTAADFEQFFYCPSSCAQVEVGFQVLTGESSKVLIVDDLVVSPQIQSVGQKRLAAPVKYKRPNSTQSINNATFTTVNYSTQVFDDDGLVTTGASWVYTCPYAGVYRVSATAMFEQSSAWLEGQDIRLQIKKNSSTIESIFTYDLPAVGAGAPHPQPSAHIDGTIECAAGDTLHVEVYQDTGSSANLIADANPLNTIDIQQISRDTQDHYLAYDSKTSVHSSVQVHELLTSNAYGGSSSGEAAIANFEQTNVNQGSAIDWVAATTTTGQYFNINETGIYHISFSARGGATPDHAGITVNAKGSSDPNGSGADETGTAITGVTKNRILAMASCDDTAGHDDSYGCAAWAGLLTKGDRVRAHMNGNGTAGEDRYQFCITKIAAGTLLGVPKPLVGYIKDQKSSGTISGTFTAGSDTTRTLQTTSGDFSLFGSLSSNQFTLEPGTYDIDFWASAWGTNSHKAKIRNISDGTDAIIGSAEYSDGATATTSGTHSRGEGTITITTSKTFELQHRCSTTAATDGYGVNNAYGEDEVFASIKIVKRA